MNPHSPSLPYGLVMGDSPLDVAQLVRASVAALAKGDAAQAQALLDQVIAVGRADAAIWLAMAHVRAMLGDQAGKAIAIDQALTLEPGDLSALIAKGDHLVSAGDQRGASAFYGAALKHAARFNQLPPHLQAALRRAQTANQRLARELEDFVRANLDAQGFGDKQAPPRFARAVDLLLGKKRVYLQEPHYLYFPELPQIQFYDRREFPWLDLVEAATPDIRDELLGVMGEDFRPYLTQTPGRPQRDQLGLVDNPSWSAFFLYKDGIEMPGAARCRRTLAALQAGPLTAIPDRAPSILFSKLAAGAHIPPHTGMLNARLICHLPLVAPLGCEFRVGNDVRPWVEGVAWVFDDTIEHEAWNRSGQDRYLLLFDIWRPELSDEERAGVAALCRTIDGYGDKVSWDG